MGSCQGAPSSVAVSHGGTAPRGGPRSRVRDRRGAKGAQGGAGGAGGTMVWASSSESRMQATCRAVSPSESQ